MQMFFSNGERVDEILGAAPEPTIRTKVEDILKRFPTDEVGRLKALLSSWVEHNKKHSEKFNKWVEKANNLESDPIYSRARQAAKELEKVNQQLSQVLTQLPK
jgi:thioredoxin-like negative regulator of GroEL